MTRPTLNDLELSVGKRVRLGRMLNHYGPGGSTLLVLPVDQGMEHGPRDFFVNPDSLNPDYVFSLAAETGYSAIAVQYGLANKYIGRYPGAVPLILKINGKSEIPPAAAPRSPLTARVEDAVRIGADAIGYTLYFGSAQQELDFENFSQVRLEAERAGLPVVVWAYPRGSDIDGKGGRDSIYAIDYATRVATELGADVVKVNYPVQNSDGSVGPVRGAPKPYDTIVWPNLATALEQIMSSAGHSLVIMSGGSRVSDNHLLERVEVSMAAGASGLIYGRNIWQRERSASKAIIAQIKDRMRAHAL